MAQYVRARIMCFLSRIIVGAIIDNRHIGALAQGIAHNLFNGLRLLIGGNDDPNNFSVRCAYILP